jgi:hypothetical protein
MIMIQIVIAVFGGLSEGSEIEEHTEKVDSAGLIEMPGELECSQMPAELECSPLDDLSKVDNEDGENSILKGLQRST